MKEHNSALTKRAQELRKGNRATRQEKHLWYDFLRDYPLQFHRQVIFGYYIVDFYCPDAGLVIEVDGSQHFEPEAIAYDAQRTAELEGAGCTVIRYTNEDIDRRFYSVCEEIDHRIKQLLKADTLS